MPINVTLSIPNLEEATQLVKLLTQDDLDELQRRIGAQGAEIDALRKSVADDVSRLSDAVVLLTKVAHVEDNSERDRWERVVEQNQRNTDYYRNLIVQIGEIFGVEAKIKDDSGISEDVLCAKAPELVARLIAASK